MKNKKFDCVEMKKSGAKVVLKKTSVMSRKEELGFWHQQTQTLITEQNKSRSKNKPAEKVFAEWDNPKDSDYDKW